MSNDPKLSIWNELKEADTRNLKFYDSLTPEQKKKVGLFPILRWMSGIKGNNPELQEYYIETVNRANMGYFDLGGHPELQWMLIAASGLGASVKHDWIPNAKRSTTNKLDKLLYDYMPYLNDDELRIVKSRLTSDKLKEICRKYGMVDSEIKGYIDEFKKINKK